MQTVFTPREDQDTQDPLVENVVLLGGYAMRALRRHLVLAIAIFSLTLALSFGLLLVSSPLYRVETRVLVNNDDTMVNLTQPRRPLGQHEGANATAGFIERLRSRDNFLWLVDHLDLLTSWEKTRTPFGQFVDDVFEKIYGPPTREEMLERLVYTLGTKIQITTSERLLNIVVEWHDPAMAQAIAQALEDHFLTGQRETAQNQIKETFAILEGRLGEAKRALALAEHELTEAAELSNQNSARAFDRRNKNNPDLETVASLEREVQKRREAILRLETAYDARVSQAEATLNALRSTLGAGHPDVANAERTLALQQRRPDALLKLSAEEAKLSAQLNHLMPGITAARLFDNMAVPAGVDPVLEAALTEYRRRVQEHNDLSDRLQAARIELETAEAAFAYRYVVTLPAIFPREPVKPKPIQIIAAGTAAALVLAFICALLKDLTSGKVQESWQISRFLGVPLLGEVERHA